MIGYTLSDPATDDSWPTFEWDLPKHFNIAAACMSAPTEAIAIRYVDTTGEQVEITYGQLTDAVAVTASRLAALGVSRGDAVGVRLPQSPELIVAHLATLSCGGVVVPLSMLLSTDHLSHAIGHSETSVLVVDKRTTAETTAALDPAVVTLSVEPQPAPEHDGLGGLRLHVEDGPESEAQTVANPVDTHPDEPAFLLYTSGTTDTPKGVVQGHQYLIGSLPGYQCWCHLFTRQAAAASRVWTPAEWAWAGALFNVVYPTLALGGTVVAQARRSGFDPDRALGIVAATGVTHSFMPPTALSRIREADVADDHDLSRLRILNCGGEPLSTDLRRWAESALDLVVNETYGQTEANALVGECRAAYYSPPESMGRPYPGHQIVVVDDQGQPVDDGVLGRLALRTPDPACFLGYHDDAEATADAFRWEGLLDTSDVAVRSANGTLTHHGRADSLIITSGYRVSPPEVEAALTSHPAVNAAVVAGVPDETRGQRVAAAVVLSSTVTSPADPTNQYDLDEYIEETLRTELLEHAKAKLGAHKTPRELRFVTSLSETRTGKVDRREIFDN